MGGFKNNAAIFVISFLGFGALCAAADFTALDSSVPPLIAGVLRDPNMYKGELHKTTVGQQGLFCDGRSQVDLAWSSEFDGARVYLDQVGNTAIEVKLRTSALDSSGYSRNRFLCLWAGGHGVVDLGHIDLTFKLSPNAVDNYPSVIFDDLTLSDIDIKDVGVGLRNWPLSLGNAPSWLDGWLDRNVHGILTSILTDNLRAKLNVYLSDQLRKKIQGQERLD